VNRFDTADAAARRRQVYDLLIEIGKKRPAGGKVGKPSPPAARSATVERQSQRGVYHNEKQ